MRIGSSRSRCCSSEKIYIYTCVTPTTREEVTRRLLPWGRRERAATRIKGRRRKDPDKGLIHTAWRYRAAYLYMQAQVCMMKKFISRRITQQGALASMRETSEEREGGRGSKKNKYPRAREQKNKPLKRLMNFKSASLWKNSRISPEDFSSRTPISLPPLNNTEALIPWSHILRDEKRISGGGLRAREWDSDTRALIPLKRMENNAV